MKLTTVHSEPQVESYVLQLTPDEAQAVQNVLLASVPGSAFMAHLRQDNPAVYPVIDALLEAGIHAEDDQ